MTGADVVMVALGAVAVGAGGAVVTTRHIVRAGLWLVVALGAIAGLYLTLAAELVAWVQVLIYVGAVVVLLLFAVMLTRAPIGPSDDLDRAVWPGVLVGAGSGLGLAVLFADAYRWSTVELTGQAGAEAIGSAIFSSWVLPFEVLSVLLLAALVGAIVVSRPDIGGRAVIHPVLPYVIAALLFGLGVYGVLVRRNAVLLLMAVELMLNAVNLVLVTADTTIRAALPQTGAVFALFVIVLAAAEVGVGLALVLQLYRMRQSVRLDELPLADESSHGVGAGPVTGTLGAALPAVPFVAALVGFLLPRRARVAAGLLGTLGAAGALACAVILAATIDGTVETTTRLVEFGSLPVTAGVLLNPPAAYVAVAVGVVALAVQVYSISYLHDDDRYGPYAAQVSLFTAAMLLVVVAGDLIPLLVGWEVMGICSYLLIGHDRRLPEAPAAAVKAFLVTRVGDIGFLLAIVVLGTRTGSFRLADVLAPGALDATTTTVVCLLLLAGVAGKSAQFPLHTWLPDAMAGPTPISALIHAATMVAAGIYVVTRLYPLFTASDVATNALAVIAAVTMLLGALAATAQDDIKRVLAWSTVSQIAYMTGALAVGSTAAALFHLLTHAAFKALLFLAAGAVIHAVGTNLMTGMGGLRRGMPVTFWCTTIGLGALVGVPPLAGFWSKEEILHVAGTEHGWRAVLVYAAGLATVFVTAAYATRLWLRTFFGDARSEAARHAHEPPPAMYWPVVVLAVPSALLGFAGLSPAFAEALGSDEPFRLGPDVAVPLGLAALGILLVLWAWRRRPAEDPLLLGPVRPVLANAFYLDAVQDALVVRPVSALARAIRRADESGVDGLVEGTGRTTVRLGAALAGAHRSGLPRAITAVLTGAVLLGVAAVTIVGVWP